MSDSLIGKQLGDYQIRDLLGRGGMARVYTGYDARLDRIAAVKVINSDFSPADRAEYFERFQREARAIARLNHPNIVGVYQFGQYEESYYMAMVFVEGRDLRQILREYSDRRELISVADVLNVVRGIGSALDYAHSRGVIHRDIKPSNIMLTTEANRAILTDFGLALSTSEGTLGETFGSAHYIAPEQAISSAKAVPQSDLYSLGICLYEMLTGQVPFDDPSAMTVALKHLQDPPPPPRSINPKLSAAIEHVLLRAIDKDPGRRYPSGAELIRALEGALVSQTLPDTSQISVKDVKTAIQQVAQNAAPSKPEAPAPAAKASVPPMKGPTSAVKAPIPAVKAPSPRDSAVTVEPVPKKSADSGVVPKPAAITVPPYAAAEEVPPPPAEAVSTERGNSSAMRPPEWKIATSSAPVVTAGRPGRPSVGLLGLLAVVIIVIVLIGGYVVGRLIQSVRSPVATTNQTQVAQRATAGVPTAAVTNSAGQSPTVVSTTPDRILATVSSTDSQSTAATDIPTVATLPATLLSPSAIPTLSIAGDATLVLTATTIATVNIGAGTAGAPVEANDVLLLYNVSQLDLYNQTTRSISLTGVAFNQAGTDRTFTADTWLKTAPSLKPGECYRLFIPSSIVIPPAQNLRLT